MRFIISMLALNFCASTAVAWPSVTLDGNVSAASSPENIGFIRSSPSYGFGIGANLDWNDSAQVTKAVLRADLNCYRWSEHSASASGSYLVVPLFFGARLYLPLKIFIDGGFELNNSIWQSKYTGPLYGTLSNGSSSKHRSSELGIAPGIGYEYLLSNKTTIGAQARFHAAIKGQLFYYNTMGIFVGYHY